MHRLCRLQPGPVSEEFRMNKLLHCACCDRTRVPEGGVQLGPRRWYCASCWHAFFRNLR